MYPINKEKLITTFIDMVKIPSPSWHEHEVIEYITARLKSLAIPYKKIKCKDSFNLLISVKGKKKIKPVLFSAHTDTVTPCENITPIISGTKISSDGTTILGSDDKAAIAIFLEGLRYLKESSMEHGPVEIFLSCAEEIGLQGAKNFDFSQVRSSRAFVFDSDGNVGRIIMHAPYQSTMGVTIKGKAAHAGMEPEKGISAIEVLAEIITKIPSGRIDNDTTANVGIISGGKATNIVADHAWCKLEVRSINKSKLKKYEDLIKNTIKETTSIRKAKYILEYNLEYSGFALTPKDTIVKTVIKAMEQVNIKPQFAISGGGSDTNIFNKSGINAVNLSCGMRNPHTTKEYIEIKDLVNGVNLMLAIIENA